MSIDERIVSVAIHPGIGVARVGNSDSGYFIGPEVLNPRSLSDPMRDDRGFLKRQAARFRIFGYDAAGVPVSEVTAQDAPIEWTVQVANTKASWYQFHIALDIPEAATAPPSLHRNSGFAAAELEIRPARCSIAGNERGGGPANTLTGEFLQTEVYLGELRTEENGRLLVLGGRGKSGSPRNRTLTDFGNNDGWYDDVSDGPVHARVKIGDRWVEARGAWVVVAPPNFGPELRSVRTMRDLLEDVYIRAGMKPFPASVSFVRDILPILERLSRLQWVNKGFATLFGWNGPWNFEATSWKERLNSKTPAALAMRRQVANAFRRFDRDGASPVPWPWLYGDAMDVPPVESPRQHSTLTDTQLRMLDLWAEGQFVSDWQSGADATAPAAAEDALDQLDIRIRPSTLDEAAMDFCIADAFHPGCELTWPMRHASLYEAPYRIREAPDGQPSVRPGDARLTPTVALAQGGVLYAQAAGDLTRWMAVPWQADTASCRSAYYAGYGPRYDPYVPSFWPARVPNHVLTEEAYRRLMEGATLSAAQRRACFEERKDWTRSLLGSTFADQRAFMVDHFHKMGVIRSMPGLDGSEDYPPYMMVECLGNENATPIQEPAAAEPEVASPRIEPFDSANELELERIRKNRRPVLE